MGWFERIYFDDKIMYKLFRLFMDLLSILTFDQGTVDLIAEGVAWKPVYMEPAQVG